MLHERLNYSLLEVLSNPQKNIQISPAADQRDTLLFAFPLEKQKDKVVVAELPFPAASFDNVLVRANFPDFHQICNGVVLLLFQTLFNHPLANFTHLEVQAVKKQKMRVELGEGPEN